jgi:hypothetical protein
MKRNMILKTLTAVILGTAALQVQAQGIYVNKKGGESKAYPSTILDRVSPYKLTTSPTTTENREKGVTATLQYEKIADMRTARMGHQIFPSGDGFVVVGGHTTNFELTKTAEIYQNGKWKDISINTPHDGAFSVILNDGRVMVGGGFSSKNGVGQSKATDVFDPKTQTFTKGPNMTIARAYCKAIQANGKVYVNGNWYADNQVMDCYNGTTFNAVGSNMIEVSNPYMFASNIAVWTWSMSGTKGEALSLGKSKDGNLGIRFVELLTSSNETGIYLWSPSDRPLPLTDDVRSSNYYNSKFDEYLYLTKDDNGQYKLHYVNVTKESGGIYRLEIPNTFPGTQTTIDYRGSVFVNESKDEIYLIGSSGTPQNQTVYLISYDYMNGNWTIAKANGFKYDLMSGAWTLLNDGRLACTGGGITGNFDAQKYAYIFTPPVAGAIDNNAESNTEYGVKVYMLDGEYDSYKESELESITTYEE